ncbi:MAG: hypothetical protein AAGH45_04425 [Pseudomonadota bacterium]
MDRQRIINGLALFAATLATFAYGSGFLSAANGFFVGLLILAVYAGLQLERFEGAPLLKTAVSLVTRPSAHPRPTAFMACLITLGLSGAIMASAVLV